MAHVVPIGSAALGFGNTIIGYASDVIGISNYNTIIGAGNSVTGSNNVIIGHGNIVHGDNNIVIGDNKTITGDNQFVISCDGKLPISDDDFQRMLLFSTVNDLLPEVHGVIREKIYQFQITREQLLLQLTSTIQQCMTRRY